MEVWQSVLEAIRPARTQFLEALIGRNKAKVVEKTEQFYRVTIDVTMALPRALEVRLTDPKLRRLLAAMLERVEPS